jgi:hypothetical protein
MGGAAQDSRLPDLVLVPPERSPHPDVVEAFEIRCWARAYLAEVGLMDFHEATDSLQELAESNGLVDRINQDEVQSRMAAAFEAVRGISWDFRGDNHDHVEPAFEADADQSYRTVARDGVSTAAEMQRDQELASRHQRIDGGPAASTVAALEYLIAQNDPARLCAWLAKRPGEERRALKCLVVPT